MVAAEDDRIADVARALEDEAPQDVPIEVSAVQVDLAAYDGVETLWRAVRLGGRTPGAVAINAGVGVGGDFVRENALSDELNLISLNITGAVHLAKLVLPDMIAQCAGGLLFTSSIAASAPGPYHATYAPSKAFLLSFAEAIRYELRDTGVTSPH